MKRTITTIILALTLSTTAFAQSPWDFKAKASVITFAAAMTADCLSSAGLRENNVLIRNARGRVNQGLCFGVNGGALALTLALQKKWPRAMNVMRWVGAGAHTGLAVNNWTKEAQR